MNRNDPNLIDFPCSYSWRAYYQETFYGETLPRLEPKLETLSEERITRLEELASEEQWTARRWDTVNQLRGEVLFLSNKIMEMRASRKPQRTFKYK